MCVYLILRVHFFQCTLDTGECGPLPQPPISLNTTHPRALLSLSFVCKLLPPTLSLSFSPSGLGCVRVCVCALSVVVGSLPKIFEGQNNMRFFLFASHFFVFCFFAFDCCFFFILFFSYFSHFRFSLSGKICPPPKTNKKKSKTKK